jgi:hypothetical protein
MLANNVIVNADFIAKPVEEILYCGKQSEVYSLHQVDNEENAEHYRGKLIVPAKSPRRVIIAKAMEKIRARAEAMH